MAVVKTKYLIPKNLLPAPVIQYLTRCNLMACTCTKQQNLSLSVWLQAFLSSISMQHNNEKSYWKARNVVLVHYSLFINKRFALNEMFKRNASKFAIFNIRYSNPKIKNRFQYGGTQNRQQKYTLITVL